MRLIDADVLKEQIESHVVSMSVCLSMDEHYGKVTMREDCLQDIANATTVEAIPIDWLDDRANDITHAPLYRRYVQMLIDEWQEEQEAR